MRFLTGFAPGAIPELVALYVDSKTPMPHSADRRFLFLAEPGRLTDLGLSGDTSGPLEASATMVVLGAGTRRRDLEALVSFQPGLILAEPSVTGLTESLSIIRIVDARAALAAILRARATDIRREVPFAAGEGNTIHPTAVVDGLLEGDVTVEAGAVIRAGAYIGRGSRIEANAVIREHVVIGANTVIQAGVVVGAAGFGFYADPTTPPPSRGPRPMPHLAGVRLGADCFVGANTVIAAGVLHPTTIGESCKLDSHVQIAHNVVLGAGALMASQSGIAGSTTIGTNFRMGGAASVAGHLCLGNNVSVAAKSGVTKDVADGETVAGFPARPIAQWRRDVASSRAGHV
jgi:UDP-3-O-[3-hydroxymyristoyl] glucosamine N-acyltransferase LpxD